MTADPLDTLPPSAPAGAADNVLLRVMIERLNGFGVALGELKGLMTSMDQRQQKAEVAQVAATATMEAAIKAAHTRLDDQAKDILKHGDDIKSLQAGQQATDKQIERFAVGYRLMAFIGSALGISVIAFIWSLITGQARVTFGGP